MIRVWKFEDAPASYRALSTNGGDEDWVAEIPKGYTMWAPMWVEAMDSCREPQEIELDDVTVYIGSHA